MVCTLTGRVVALEPQVVEENGQDAQSQTLRDRGFLAVVSSV